MKPNNNEEKRPIGRPRSNKKKYLISSLPENIEKIRAYIKKLHETNS